MNSPIINEAVRAAAPDDLRYLQRELLFRMAVQNMTILFNALALIVVLAIQYAFARSAAGIGFTFALIAAIMAAIWCHHGARQAQIKTYILILRTSNSATTSWESWLPHHGYKGLLGSRWFISTKAVFRGSSLAALLLGIVLDRSAVGLFLTGLGFIVNSP